MARYTFAQLDRWVLKSWDRMDAVAKGSTQAVVEVAQTPKAKGGRMPVVTSNLRNSLMSSIAGSIGEMGPASHIMVAASMRAGDVARFTWTANYSAAVNNGARGRPGAHFREWAVDQWPQIVRRETAKAKAAIK